MKLFNAFAVAAVIGTLFIAANPAAAGRFYSLKYNVGISKNDGNPRLVISDGSRLTVLLLEENKNPLKDGGYGYTKTYSLNRDHAAMMAEMLHGRRNCVDTLSASKSSTVGDVYERAMYMSC